MEEKKTVLIRLSYLVDLNESDINEDDGILNKLSRKLCKDRSFQIDNHRFKLFWEFESEVILDSEALNCGKCVQCNRWVTDVDKEDRIEGLCYGARVDGKLLCDECLPKDHPVAF